jgi:hypothetical protein
MKTRSDRDYTLRVETAGRRTLEHRLLASGFQVAEPAYDSGIDLIVFQEQPFIAWPVQMKAATGEPISVDRKYEGRNIYMAYVLRVFDPAPRIAILPYSEAVRIVATPHEHTSSWVNKGIWRYPALNQRAE